jgi:uncharacterized protein (TIGR02594 family)
MKIPNWLVIAKKELGECEIPGSGDNPRIVEYLKATSLEASEDHDATPWCSAFVNWCMQKAGFKGTRSAWAQSWADWGKEVEPCVGAIVVFRWDNGTGHVGFIEDWDDDGIKVLGGNQQDQVCEERFGWGHVIATRMPAHTPVEMVEV